MMIFYANSRTGFFLDKVAVFSSVWTIGAGSQVHRWQGIGVVAVCVLQPLRIPCVLYLSVRDLSVLLGRCTETVFVDDAATVAKAAAVFEFV